EVATEIPADSFVHARAGRVVREPVPPHRQSVRAGSTEFDPRRYETPRHAGYGVRHATRPRTDRGGTWIWIAVGFVLLVLVVSSHGRVVGPLLMVGVLAGVGYLAVRSLTLAAQPHSGQRWPGDDRYNAPPMDPGRGPVESGAAQVAALDHGHAARGHAVPVRHSAPIRPARVPSPSTPRSIALRCRVADMTASMALAALCTALLTGGLSLVVPFLNDPSRILVFGTVTLGASWSVIAVSKLLWEGTRTDGVVKRVTLLVVGGLVGAAAWWTSEMLLVGPARDFLRDDPLAAPWDRVGLFTSLGSHELIDASHRPTLAGFVVFFAGLLALRRWWRHADAFRKRRFRVASLLLTVGIAYLVASVWSFPPLWAIVWAATISSVVQLASVWVPPDDRLPLVAEGRSHV
ncbi:MAG TPA: hypothetical protein VML55_08200, partial [Planctomycetaceae bacterium]|nr:hypothetical protein [Planctomycetaceae bacterium]